MNVKLESLNKTIEVKKQPVGKFIACLKVLKNIPKHLGGLDKLGETEIIAHLPDMIVSSYDEVIEIVTIATELTKEEAEQLFTEELVDLVADIIQVNEFNKIGESVKKKFGSLNLLAKKK